MLPGRATQAERKAALGKAPVYVYYFQWESPVRGGKLRAVHSVEIPFVFDNVALADALSGAWTRFAHTGNPNGKGLPDWPAYSADKRHVMIFDKTSRVDSDPRRQERLAIAAIKARQSA